MNSIDRVNPVNEFIRWAEKSSLAQARELTLKEKTDVRLMEQEDRNIREHEREHQRAARDLAIGKSNFKYKEGPDGNMYAIHGEVIIESHQASLASPEESLEKALKVRNAALAPADPSPQDLRVATQARIMESKAYRKMARETDNNTDNQNTLLPGAKVYQETMDFQKNLYKILDLFS